MTIRHLADNIDAHAQMVEKVREVIANLRAYRGKTPPNWNHLDAEADKLARAIGDLAEVIRLDIGQDQDTYHEAMGEQSPASLIEALNVIENWAQRGNVLAGDDVGRFLALADRIAPSAERHWTPDKTDWMLSDIASFAMQIDLIQYYLTKRC